MEKIVISDSDLEKVESEPSNVAPSSGSGSHSIKVWMKVLVVLLVPVLPLLSLVALFVLLANRGGNPQKSVAWTKFLAHSLIASGLISSLLALSFYFHSMGGDQSNASNPENPPPSSESVEPLRPVSFPLDGIESFPAVPKENYFPGNAEKAINSTVFLVAAKRDGLPWANSPNMGAAALLWSSSEVGYLFGTAAHVVKDVQKIRIASNRDPERALEVTLVGTYPDADLALLWMKPSGKETAFLQPILSFGDTVIGSTVFSIGHPEGHLFTFSQGLLSQKRAPDVLQTDAAVSPGNSGGPLYDSQGYLLAIVSFVHDKAQDPNAENLNFGYRADLFLESSERWKFLRSGSEIHQKFVRAHMASRAE